MDLKSSLILSKTGETDDMVDEVGDDALVSTECWGVECLSSRKQALNHLCLSLVILDLAWNSSAINNFHLLLLLLLLLWEMHLPINYH